MGWPCGIVLPPSRLRVLNPVQALQVMLCGVPGFFTPRIPPAPLQPTELPAPQRVAEASAPQQPNPLPNVAPAYLDDPSLRVVVLPNIARADIPIFSGICGFTNIMTGVRKSGVWFVMRATIAIFGGKGNRGAYDENI